MRRASSRCTAPWNAADRSVVQNIHRVRRMEVFAIEWRRSFRLDRDRLQGCRVCCRRGCLHVCPGELQRHSRGNPIRECRATAAGSVADCVPVGRTPRGDRTGDLNSGWPMTGSYGATGSAAVRSTRCETAWVDRKGSSADAREGTARMACFRPIPVALSCHPGSWGGGQCFSDSRRITGTVDSFPVPRGPLPAVHDPAGDRVGFHQERHRAGDVFGRAATSGRPPRRTRPGADPRRPRAPSTQLARRRATAVAVLRRA